MTWETILIQRNALGGEKCRQFKFVYMYGTMDTSYYWLAITNLH